VSIYIAHSQKKSLMRSVHLVNISQKRETSDHSDPWPLGPVTSDPSDQ